MKCTSLHCPSYDMISGQASHWPIVPPTWTLPPKLMDPTCGPDLLTQLVDPTGGALKTRSYSGLDLWIVHVLEVFDSWNVPP